MVTLAKEKTLHKTEKNLTKFHPKFWEMEQPLPCSYSQPSLMQTCLSLPSWAFSAVSAWTLPMPLATNQILQQPHW